MKATIRLILVFLFIIPNVLMAQKYDNRLLADARTVQKPEKSNHDGKEKRNDTFGKFDPEKYQRDLEAFITKEARLTPQEAQAFFPVFRELQAKQRAIYMKQRKPDKPAVFDNKLAMEAIRYHDMQEIEIKKLQQQYHNRFLKILPATKVLICIHAEERFNRNMMRNMTRH